MCQGRCRITVPKTQCPDSRCRLSATRLDSNVSMSHFFAYLSRMKLIQRWSLMRTTYGENVQEHSLRVAMIAHALAMIRNQFYGGTLNPDRAAVLAMYHDASEVITGDMPTPVKYYSDEIREAYKSIERAAENTLLEMLPAELRRSYEEFLGVTESDEYASLVKAADKLCAYITCLEEIAAGNREFTLAKEALRTTVEATGLPEVDYFMKTFVPSFSLTLDELSERT